MYEASFKEQGRGNSYDRTTWHELIMLLVTTALALFKTRRESPLDQRVV